MSVHRTDPPVLQGVVPKNDFGNVDLYVPTMLPAGGAFIPRACDVNSEVWRPIIITLFLFLADKGAAKIARQLGFDFAEAVVRVVCLMSRRAPTEL